MAPGSVAIKQARTRREIKAFVGLPWSIYKNDQYWVPPQRSDLMDQFQPAHPFFEHARMDLFMAFRDGRPVGRVAGIVDQNYIDFHNEPIAFFGFFESVNDPEVAKAIFDHLKAWAKELGFDKIRGPFNPSTNDPCGFLAQGFDDPPTLLMPYNPPYYLDLIKGCGLTACKDLPAYIMHRSPNEFLNRIAQKVHARLPGLTVRPIKVKELREELSIFLDVYNSAWSENWGFVPITDSEIEHLASQLKWGIVPELIQVAELDSEPIGVIVSFPDYNFIFKKMKSGRMTPLGLARFLFCRNKITKARVWMLGVKKKYRQLGVETVLISDTWDKAYAWGIESAEMSWILDDNLPMRRAIERIGGEVYKVYRIFEGQTG